MIASTQVIGILFPVSLPTLAVSLYRSRVVPPLIALSLAGGAVLFPLRRIAGLPVGLIGGDLLPAVAFGVIGCRLLSAGRRLPSPELTPGALPGDALNPTPL